MSTLLEERNLGRSWSRGALGCWEGEENVVPPGGEETVPGEGRHPGGPGPQSSPAAWGHAGAKTQTWLQAFGGLSPMAGLWSLRCRACDLAGRWGSGGEQLLPSGVEGTPTARLRCSQVSAGHRHQVPEAWGPQCWQRGWAQLGEMSSPRHAGPWCLGLGESALSLKYTAELIRMLRWLSPVELKRILLSDF